MGLLDVIRGLFGRVGDVADAVDHAVLDAVHKAEDAVDEATGGKYYDAVEKLDEEANELGEKLHLDDPRLDNPN